MTRVNMTEAKRSFLDLVDRVQAGERIEIVDGRTGRVRAVLKPVPRRRGRLPRGGAGRPPSPLTAAPDVGAGTGEAA